MMALELFKIRPGAAEEVAVLRGCLMIADHVFQLDQFGKLEYRAFEYQQQVSNHDGYDFCSFSSLVFLS